MGHPLIEILGIEAAGLTDALHMTLSLQDEVCTN